jgi:hypothetical protein
LHIVWLVGYLMKVTNKIGENTNSLEEDGSESIASRFVAEIESEYYYAISSEYLHVEHRFDPRVTALTIPGESQTWAERMEEQLDKAKRRSYSKESQLKCKKLLSLLMTILPTGAKGMTLETLLAYSIHILLVLKLNTRKTNCIS